jgi:hypothetical protein
MTGKRRVAKSERGLSWALMAFPRKWRRHSGRDLVATALADLRPGARTVPPFVLADIVLAGLDQRARGVPAAGRSLIAAYGRFLRLPAIGVVLFLAPRLFYNASRANLVAVGLGIVVAGCTFIRSGQLKTVRHRALGMVRSRGNNRRQAQRSI